ncbi:MAG: transporter, family, multidrug resistance protein [Thermoproteota archaeon]|nr:transporter, family, multidrug resistance protein [Thermoproteota archaeon]
MQERRTVIRDILSIYVPAFFLNIGMSIVSPILPTYARSFDVSYTVATIAISIYATGRLAADLPVGFLGDRIGRRPVMLVGIAIIAVGAFLCSFANNFWELVFYRLLQGVGSAMWQTMRQTMLQDILKPEERGRILGYFQAFTLIGSSAGPSIGGIVADTWGIRAPFIAYSLGSLVCFVLSFVLISESKNTHASHGKEKHESEGFSWPIMKRLLMNAGFITACFATMANALQRQGTRNTLIPLYGDTVLKLNATDVGFALSLATFANLFITIPTGYALDRLGRKAVLVPSLALTSIMAWVFTLTGDFTQLALACIFLGFSQGIGGQAPLTMASDSTMDLPHGISMGLFRVFTDIGFIIGPIMVGAIIDLYGMTAAFYSMAAVTFASMVFVQVFAHETLPKKKK